MTATQAQRHSTTPELDSLRGTMAAGIGSMSYEVSDDRHASETRLEGIRLGTLDVMRYQGRGEHRGERQRKHILKDTTDNFIVVVPSAAYCGLRQGGVQKDYSPGTLVIVSMLSPFHAYIRGADEQSKFSAICVRVPGPLLRVRVPHIDDLCNCAIPITPGVSHIMQSLCEMTLIDGPFLQHSDTEVLGNTLVDLMANAVRQASQANRLRLPGRMSSLERTMEQAKRFIEANLSNPELSTAMIAANGRVSVRYLHAAFAAASTTIAGHVRELRLQRCREALRCAELRDRSIIEIAGTWGFVDSSTFSRAYRSRFGVAPNRDRGLDLS